MALISDGLRMMDELRVARQHQLLESWIGAGFVRSKVWETLHCFEEPTPLNDIDVLFFDPNDLREEREKAIEHNLAKTMPDLPWSIKNQARMHLYNDDPSYSSTANAMNYWLETPTCTAVRLGKDDKLHLIAPFGINDLLKMIIRPTPAGRRRPLAYGARISEKNWQRYWPKCQVIV